jgi:hypothetical protein
VAGNPHATAGGATAPLAEAVLDVDVYSGTYPCVRWDVETIAKNPGVAIDNGAEHVVTFAMRTPGESLVGPGFSAIVWYDHLGQLGKLSYNGADVPVATVAAWIDGGYLLTVQHDPQAHPVLVVVAAVEPAPPPTEPPAERRWLEATDVADYLDIPGDPDERLVACVYAVRAAVERRRDDLTFAPADAVPADVRVGALRWAGLMYQSRGAPSGFTGYDTDTTLYDVLGAQRAEIMRLLGWRRPVVA